MARILIVYSTCEGQTRRIAEHIAERCVSKGYTVILADASMEGGPALGSDVAACIVGASVYEGRHQRPAVHFVREHRTALDSIPTAFFSVSLAAAVKDEEHRAAAAGYIDTFVDETGWSPNLAIPLAGALRFAHHDYVKSALARLLPSPNREDQRVEGREYTNWESVEWFTDTFLLAAHIQLEPTEIEVEGGGLLASARAMESAISSIRFPKGSAT